MPPAVSNPEGHFEDMSLVDLHDRLLRLNGTDWRFHDEGELDPEVRLDLMERYMRRREATAQGPWGAKDPRTCLFLPAWRKVLGEQGQYLVVLRHWSGCLQSLYRRHAEALALGEGNAPLHASFWQNPTLAARMWLAYNRRILSLLDEAPKQCLAVTQQAVLAGLPVIEHVNARFHLELDGSTPSPIRHSLSHDRIEASIRERLPSSLLEELDRLWAQLLAHADHQADNEVPQWVPDIHEDTQMTDTLLAAAQTTEPLTAASADTAALTGSLQEQLAQLADNDSLPLDEEYWRGRIEQEARFVPECWEFLARALLNRGHARRAERLFAQVMLCGKSEPYLFMLLGTGREAELDDEGAEHFYRLAVARNDANATFHVRLAKLWLTQGRYQQAEGHLRQALERHPGNPALIHALANCLDQQVETKAAIDLLQEQAGRSPLLANLLATLQLKQEPEGVGQRQRASGFEAANQPDVQRAAAVALASVMDLGARHDLARRLGRTWRRHGAPLLIIPE